MAVEPSDPAIPSAPLTADAPLSEAIADVADLCGLATATALVAACGGTVVYIPRTPGPDHPLAIALGLDRAGALAQHFAGCTIDVPMHLTDTATARRRLVLRLRAEGLTAAQIARRCRCTQRRVWQILAGAGAGDDTRQPSLL